MKTMRKGTKVRYIGEKYKDIAKDQVFIVRKKEGSLITLYFPTVYLGGEIHNSKVALPISDFEIVE